MAVYRIYLVDVLNRRQPAREVICHEDHEAREMARGMIPGAGGSAEVWNGMRMVAHVGPYVIRSAPPNSRSGDAVPVLLPPTSGP
jgi:hypothetical protein